MKELLDGEILLGFKEFLGNIEWVFLFLFVFLTWVLNIFRSPKKTAVKWYQKIPSAIKIFAFGLILSFVYMWLLSKTTKADFFEMINTITFGMVAWKFGFNKLAKKLEDKFGINS